MFGTPRPTRMLDNRWPERLPVLRLALSDQGHPGSCSESTIVKRLTGQPRRPRAEAGDRRVELQPSTREAPVAASSPSSSPLVMWQVAARYPPSARHCRATRSRYVVAAPHSAHVTAPTSRPVTTRRRMQSAPWERSLSAVRRAAVGDRSRIIGARSVGVGVREEHPEPSIGRARGKRLFRRRGPSNNAMPPVSGRRMLGSER